MILPAAETDLAERIAVVEAKLAIHELAANYNHAIDFRKIDLFMSLWAEGAIWDMTPAGLGVATGAQEIRNQLQEMIDSWVPHHVTANIVITGIDGDTARGRSGVVSEARANQPGAEASVVFASNQDEYVRVNGAWKFARRVVTIYWHG